MAFAPNLDTLQAYKPRSLSTDLTLSGGAVAATKVTPTVAAGSIGIEITGIFVKYVGTDASITIKVHHKNSGGSFKEIVKKATADATAAPVQMLAAANFPGLLLLNSGSPVFFLGEGEELGIEIADGTTTDHVTVLVNYHELFIES